MTTHGVQTSMPATPTAKGRSPLLAGFLQDLEGLAPSADHRKTRNGRVLASQGLSPLLELDFQRESQRSTLGKPRDSSLDQEDGGSQPALGCSPYPWRAVEARDHALRAQRLPTHAPKSQAPFPNLEDLAREPRERARFGRLLHGADRDFSSPLRSGSLGSPSALRASFQCHRASDGGVDCAADPRSVSGRSWSTVLDPRSRYGLWRAFPRPRERNGHHRSAYGASKSVAKRICGEIDRVDPAGMPGPRGCAGKPASPKDLAQLFRLLP